MILGIFLGYLANMSTVLDENALQFLFAWWVLKTCCFEVNSIALFPLYQFSGSKVFSQCIWMMFQAV